MNFQTASVDSIIIYFGDSINKEVSDRVLSSYELILKEEIEGLIEIVPSYTSIFIQFDIFKYDHNGLFEKIKDITENNSFDNKNKSENRLIKIPVYYDEEVGYDLKRVADLNSLTIKEVINIHSSKVYRVYTIGFAPGFGYMGEVDNRIKTPRLESPRQKIPAKSVALADLQSAVYPSSSPGGWNILGRTYIDMFDKNLEGFSYLSIGDSVKFEPISKDEFLRNGGEI